MLNSYSRNWLIPDHELAGLAVEYEMIRSTSALGAMTERQRHALLTQIAKVADAIDWSGCFPRR